MSVSPLPSLRSLWAQGGAPAAFVRRDSLLASALERIVQQAGAAESLDGEKAFERLVAGFSFSDVFAADRSPLAPADSLAVPAGVSRRPVAGSPAEGAAANVAEQLAALSSAGRPDARWTSRSRAVSTEYTGRGNAQREAGTWPGESAGPARGSIVTGTMSGGGHERTRGRAAHSDGAGTAVPEGVTVANSGPLHGAGNARSAAATFPGRNVAPVRRMTDPNMTAKVAAILSASMDAVAANASPATARDSAAGARGEEAAAPLGANAPVPVAAMLGRAVQRVEQRQAAVRRGRADSRNLDDDAAANARPAPGLQAGGESRSARVVAGSMGRTADAPHAGGLRGLAERAGTQRGERAAFFASVMDEQDPSWPDGELDRFATLLDDAARHEGVDLDEGAM